MKTFTKLTITGFFFLFLSFNANGQGLWGMTSKGGDEDMGVIFKTDGDGSNFSVVKNFEKGYPGKSPGLLVTNDYGILYGVTKYGGAHNLGVLYKYDYVNDEYTVLYNFGDNGETYNPDLISLVLSGKNKLYGYSKRYQSGYSTIVTLFKFDLSSGIFSEIRNFSSGWLVGRLTLASDGNIYGCQAEDYSVDNPIYGYLIGINTNSDQVFTLHQFNVDTEGLPVSGVSEDNGVLYGNTNYKKTIFFKYDLSASKFTILKELLSDEDFIGDPVYDNGIIYGLTSNGTSSGNGGIYKFDISGSIFSFINVFHDKEVPCDNLIMGKDGCLYGTTYYIGDVTGKEGVFYKVSFDQTTSGTYSVIHNYTEPFHYEYLTESGNYGNIYIIDRSDGNDLNVWVPASDYYKFKFRFTSYETGRYPKGSLAVNKNKTLTGYTLEGGDSNKGTSFNYDHSDQSIHYTTLYDDVKEINGKLTLVTNNGFQAEYALAKLGGDNDKGAIYDQDFAVFSFDGTNGAYPNGTMIEAANGKLYGLTTEGGSNDKGVIFEYDFRASPRTYTKLMDFDGTNGANPYGSLVEASDGRLYGMTSKGGTNDMGTIFYYNTSNGIYIRKFDKLVDFNGTNGKYPFGDLVETADGKFYGMTSEGGTYNCGTIFEYDLNSDVLTVKYNFSSSWGKNPKGGFTIGENGILFGLTNSGGDNDKGVMFSFDPSTGTYHKLVSFDGTNGANPEYTTLLYLTITPDVEELPDVSGECEVNITDFPTATNSYGEIITATTSTVFPVTSQGTTVVTWTYDDGKGNVTTQDQNIIIGIDNTVNVNGNELTANVNGAYTYQWYQRSGSWTILLQGENDRSYIAENSGTYFVEIGNGTCSARSDDITVTVTGINDAAKNGISLYPNPVDDILNIQSSVSSAISISVFDITGKKLLSVSSSDKTIRIDMTNFDKGIYFVYINTGKETITEKVIKK